MNYSIFVQYFDVSNRIWCIKENSLLHLKLFIQQIFMEHDLNTRTLAAARNTRVNKINMVPAKSSDLELWK